MTAPVGVAALRERAGRAFERGYRAWAAEASGGASGVVVDFPLHPPTERAALADLDAARDWVAAWRRAERELPIELVWTVRNWARVGSQEVPDRVTIRGAAAIAQVAGRAADWAALVERVEALRPGLRAGSETNGALRTHARAIAALDAADFERLSAVLAWLRAHPASGRFVRELPIRGVDSKWIQAHGGLVRALHHAGTGAADLGLRTASPLVRMRALDPALAIDGLTDVTAPVADLAALALRPERVFVFENLATVLAMPAVAGAVVLDGGGYRADLVAQLPWAQRVTYWGDLDSHGFAILHRLRSHDVVATSALMDSDTLLAHSDLWGTEPTPNPADLDRLTPAEQATLRLLRASGNVRLEQERIPWDYALPRLFA